MIAQLEQLLHPGAGSGHYREPIPLKQFPSARGERPQSGRRVSTDHYLVKVYSRWRSELSVLTVLGVFVWMADQCGLSDVLANTSLGPGYPSDGPTWAAFVMAVVVHLMLTVLPPRCLKTSNPLHALAIKDCYESVLATMMQERFLGHWHFRAERPR